MMKYYIIRYVGKLKGQSGESCNSKYNLANSCSVCGTGAILENPLVTKGLKNIKDSIFQTNDGDYIISNELKNQLISNNIKVENLDNIVDINGHKLPYFYLRATYSLPKASRISGLETERQCVNCKQDGFFNIIKMTTKENLVSSIVQTVKYEYHLLNKNLIEKSDIFKTWEHMGNSNLDVKGNKVLRFARPMLVVSANFKMILEKELLKNIHFEEIETYY